MPEMTLPSEKTIIDLALAELAAPTLATTQQFLSVHTLMSEGKQPVVFGVLTEAWEDRPYFEVYFRPTGQHYFIVVHVGCENNAWQAIGCSTEARCRLEFRIRTIKMYAEDITQAVGLKPTESWNAGEARRHPFTTGVYTFTGWFINLAKDDPGGLERKLSQLLDYLEPFADRIRALSERCNADVLVGYQDYRQMGGFSIQPHTLARLGQLGAALDVDLYASGPDLGDATDGTGFSLLQGN